MAVPPVTNLFGLWLFDDPNDFGKDATGLGNRDLNIIRTPSKSPGGSTVSTITGPDGRFAMKTNLADQNYANLVLSGSGLAGLTNSTEFTVSGFFKDFGSPNFAATWGFTSMNATRAILAGTNFLIDPLNSVDGRLKQTGDPMADGKWHHLAWSFNRNTQFNKAWFDGVPFNNTPSATLTSPNVFATLEEITLGARSNGSAGFGEWGIAQVTVYDTFFTDDNAVSLNNGGQGIGGLSSFFPDSGGRGMYAGIVGNKIF